MFSKVKSAAAGALLVCMSGVANAAPVYLNDQNITVSLGSGTSGAPANPAEPFNNRTTAASLASVIDAPSALAPEDHLQSTHVWLTGTLELVFDFGQEYNLTTLHIWNYFAEDFDVDNIAFAFFDSSNVNVGSLSVMPALGGSGGNPIFAEDIVLNAPLNVQFVNTVLTGTNNEVDFNNLGFTGELSNGTVIPAVPEPGTLALLAVGLLSLALRRRLA